MALRLRALDDPDGVPPASVAPSAPPPDDAHVPPPQQLLQQPPPPAPITPVMLAGYHGALVRGSLFSVADSALAGLFDAWLKALWLAPAALVTEARLGPMEAVFLPFHRFVVDSRTSVSGVVRLARQGGNAGSFDEQHVRDSFSGQHRFVVLASANAAHQGLRPLLERFVFANMVVEDALPVGDASIALLDANTNYSTRVEPRVHSADRDRASAALKQPFSTSSIVSTRVLDLTTAVERVNTDLVWLPVFVGSYTWNGASYSVVMDGVSGQVEGERPYGAGAVGRAVQWIGDTISGWFGGGGKKEEPDSANAT